MFISGRQHGFFDVPSVFVPIIPGVFGAVALVLGVARNRSLSLVTAFMFRAGHVGRTLKTKNLDAPPKIIFMM